LLGVDVEFEFIAGGGVGRTKGFNLSMTEPPFLSSGMTAEKTDTAAMTTKRDTATNFILKILNVNPKTSNSYDNIIIKI
jgi:hypothetical protein